VIVAALLTASTAHADDGACKTATQAMKAQELTRASLLVDACRLEDEAQGGKLDLELTAKLEELRYARVEIETRPTGGMVIVDAVVDLPFAAPRTVWLAPGVHDITALVDGQAVARTTLNLRADSTAMAMIELPDAPEPGGEVQELDFAGDGGPPELTTGGPEDEKFGSLLPDRYLRGVHAEGEAEVAPRRRGEWWIGAGVSTRVSPGVAVGAQRRYRIAGERTTLGLMLDVHAVGGYLAGGLGGALLLSGGHEVGERRDAYLRVTLGAGPGVAIADGTGAAAAIVFAFEITITRRWSVSFRTDFDPWHPEVERRHAAIMVGRRW